MNCSNHGEREAVGMCVRCHKLICEECKVKINNKYYCKDCVSEMYSDNNSNNNYNNRNIEKCLYVSIDVNSRIIQEIYLI